MAAIINLALKDLKLLVLDKAGIFWFLVFPLIFALFFGSLMGGGGQGASKMKLALVDQDQTPESQAFRQHLQKSDALTVQSDLQPLQAEQGVRRGDFSALVVIPKGFGASPGFFGNSAKSLEVGMDPSRKAESGYLEGILMESLFQGMAERFTNPQKSLEDIRKARQEIAKNSDSNQKKLLLDFFADFEKHLANKDFKFSEGSTPGGPSLMRPQLIKKDITTDHAGKPRSAYEITFPSALIWGLYGCVMTFAISLVSERSQGTLLRLRTTPLTWAKILAGKGLACFLACFAITALLLTIGVVAFGVRVSQPVGLFIALIMSALGFTGIMLFVSTLGKTERAVAGATSGIFMPLAMLGGGMIPLFLMPGWLQTAASVSPFKWGILAFEGAIWRNFTWTDYLLPSAMLLAFGSIGFLVGATLLTKSDA